MPGKDIYLFVCVCTTCVQWIFSKMALRLNGGDKLLNKIVDFFAHKKCSLRFIKFWVNHWWQMDYFNEDFHILMDPGSAIYESCWFSDEKILFKMTLVFHSKIYLLYNLHHCNLTLILCRYTGPCCKQVLQYAFVHLAVIMMWKLLKFVTCTMLVMYSGSFVVLGLTSLE